METNLSPIQAEELQTAINSLPDAEVVRLVPSWIAVAKTSGVDGRAMNAALAIFIASLRTDGWKVVSVRYLDILGFLKSPFPDLQRRGLQIAVRSGPLAPKATAEALQSYVACGPCSPPLVDVSTKASAAAKLGELEVRASAIQELVELAPSEVGTRKAIDSLMAENLSIEDRLMVLVGLCVNHKQAADDYIVGILTKALDDAASPIREAGAQYLGEMVERDNALTAETGSKLRRLSGEDPEPRVRAAATMALENVPGVQHEIELPSRERPR